MRRKDELVREHCEKCGGVVGVIEYRKDHGVEANRYCMWSQREHFTLRCGTCGFWWCSPLKKENNESNG